jgi:hypothetical protein
MIRYEITNSKFIVADSIHNDQITQKIENIIDHFSLIITQRSTLSTKKGSIHYHLKQGTNAGILELTYWPSKKQLWVEIHDNRTAEWNIQMIKPFSEALAESFFGELLPILN